MLSTADEQQWLASNGGPLLLLPEISLGAWGGVRTPPIGRVVQAEARWNLTPGAPATDYDRACDISEYLGLIGVGDSGALVLGGEPLNTTVLLQKLNNTAVLVRLYSAPEEAQIEDSDFLKVLDSIPTSLWHTLSFEFTTHGSTLCLFDAAHPGSDVRKLNGEAKLVFALSTGRYSIETAFYDPNEDLSFLLHRLTKQDE